MRGLSKYIDNETLVVNKEMLNVIKFDLDTTLFYLKAEPKKEGEDWDPAVCHKV
jgi:hypothetical protein